VAEAYVAEADLRLAGDSPSAAVAGHVLEKAVATLTALPRGFRQAAGLDARLAELLDRLRDMRLDSLEEMVRLEGESRRQAGTRLR